MLKSGSFSLRLFRACHCRVSDQIGKRVIIHGVAVGLKDMLRGFPPSKLRYGDRIYAPMQ
jgi:hypothetical protein